MKDSEFKNALGDVIRDMASSRGVPVADLLEMSPQEFTHALLEDLPGENGYAAYQDAIDKALAESEFVDHYGDKVLPYWILLKSGERCVEIAADATCTTLSIATAKAFVAELLKVIADAETAIVPVTA